MPGGSFLAVEDRGRGCAEAEEDGGKRRGVKSGHHTGEGVGVGGAVAKVVDALFTLLRSSRDIDRCRPTTFEKKKNPTIAVIYVIELVLL